MPSGRSHHQQNGIFCNTHINIIRIRKMHWIVLTNCVHHPEPFMHRPYILQVHLFLPTQCSSYIRYLVDCYSLGILTGYVVTISTNRQDRHRCKKANCLALREKQKVLNINSTTKKKTKQTAPVMRSFRNESVFKT